MCKLYAPADTENVPILRKKDRRTKQILSYITLTITLIIGAIVNNYVISNIIILGILFQTITITRFAYKLTNNKYGYEVYLEQEKAPV
jgi:accessory gene regulator B